MDYQLIAFDMDDTLLDSDRRISAANRRALQQMAELGIRIVLCSGRPTPSLLNLARDLFPNPDSSEYIVSFNGAAIVSVQSGRELHSTPLPHAAGQMILETARQHGLLLQAYKDHCFYTEYDDPGAQAYSTSVGMPYEIVPDLGEIIRSGSLKLLMNAPHEQLLQAKADLQPAADRGAFHMVFSKPHYLAFLHPQVNKGTALQQLCDIFSLDIARTVAVGDSHNDLEMLQQAGLAVAVANARDELKQAADIVLDSDHNQSIAAELLQKLELGA